MVNVRTPLMVLCTLSSLTVLPACLPKFLEKYRTPEPVSDAAAGEEARPHAEAAANGEPAPVRYSSRPLPSEAAPEAISMVDRNTFVVRSDAKDIWDATVTILLKNYNLNIVNKDAGIITTEWDSFYLQEKVLRNKLSIRIKATRHGESEVTIYNNVEELKEALRRDEGASSVWLPSDQGLREIGRIVQNLAISLNLATPHLPEDMMMARAGASSSDKQPN